MGRYKGLAMPRAKKKKVEVVRERILVDMGSADVENVPVQAAVAPEAAAAPLAQAPARAVPDALDEELRLAHKEAREAAWVAAELEKEVGRAQKAQLVTRRVADAKMTQWEKQARGPRNKRPCPILEMQRLSKVGDKLHASVCEIYLAQVVAAKALVEARDAQLVAKEVRIRQLLRRVRSLKKSGQRSCKARPQK